jgi:hypothetical protein
MASESGNVKKIDRVTLCLIRLTEKGVNLVGDGDGGRELDDGAEGSGG